MKQTLVFLATGFEEIETVTIIDIFRRAGLKVTIASLIPSVIEGAHGLKIVADTTIDNIQVEDFDAFIVPGGNPGYINLRKDSRVIEIIKKAFNLNKLVGAICAAPAVLSDSGILEGKNSTIYPGMENELDKGGALSKQEKVVIDNNIVTSRGPATAIPFALKLVEIMVGKQVADEVRKKTLAHMISW
jgi:4-methyl-5(b-hydroxyethyl)-thiazole monophosphate biosynthesis